MLKHFDDAPNKSLAQRQAEDFANLMANSFNLSAKQTKAAFIAGWCACHDHAHDKINDALRELEFTYPQLSDSIPNGE